MATGDRRRPVRLGTVLLLLTAAAALVTARLPPSPPVQTRGASAPVPAALARFHLAAALAERHQYREALAAYRQVLPVLSGRAEGIAVLSAMGRCYRELGQIEEAAAAFRQAAARAKALGDLRQHAAALDDLAQMHMMKGEFQPALDLFAQALEAFRRLPDAGEVAMVLCNVGEIHLDLGAWQEAIDASQQALAIQRRIGDRRGILTSVRDLGAAYVGLRQWPQAREEFEEAIRLARAQGDRAFETSAEIGLSYVHLMNGETAKAISTARDAQRLARSLNSLRGEANALGNLGAAYSRSGKTEEALASFARARSIYHQGDEPASEASILFGSAEALERAGRLDEARGAIEESLALVERLRTQAAGSDLRASFFAARQDYYELYVRVLMKLDRRRPGRGYADRAFEASESTRARTLLERLAADRLNLAAAADPDLLARQAALTRLLGATQEARDRTATGAAPETADRLARLDAQDRSLRSRLEEVRGEMRLRHRQFQVLNDTRPLTLARIQKEILDPGTLLLSYSLGAEESYLWSIDRGSAHAYRLAGRETIERAAMGMYRALAATPGAASDVEVARRSADLTALVLAPVAEKLNGQRLLIVADGALQYVPFGALPEPGALGLERAERPPLVVAHEIVYLPSASVAGLLRSEVQGRPPAPKELAMLADPVFRLEDGRVRRSLADARAGLVVPARGAARAIDAERSARDVGLDGLHRLQFTRREADAILRLVPPGLALRATDFDATRDLAISPELALYRIIHFATHGFLDAREPELSGLVLSLVDSRGRPRDGFLRAYEIYGLQLKADLVVLSACRTALGADVRGEGLMGLTRGFMYAGVPRVVVSLWNIDDRATADLMVQFYRGVLEEHLQPAAALRAAQLDSRKRWREPYYWAAFELQGDWR